MIAILISGAAVCLYFMNLLGVGNTRLGLLYCVVAALSLVGAYGVFMNCEIAFKGGLIGFLIAIVLFAGYIIAVKYGLIDLFSDREAMQSFIARYDGYAIAVFIAVQFLQVTVLPLPSTITTLAGIALFGIWRTVLYSSIGIISGSMFAFFLGRTCGVKLIVWICGYKMFNKYRRFAEGKDVLLLYAMFLLPFFPDDLLCLIAGLGTMSYKSFFVMMLITRPLGALWVAGVFKSAVSIPFAGWGIAVWAAIFAVTAVIFVLLYKYGDLITGKLSKLSEKITEKLHFKSIKKEKGSITKQSRKIKTNSLSLLYGSNSDIREIEKKAYITVYEKSEDDELAGYVSDDFGLIADSKRLGYSDEWLDKLIFCYENARIPCGEL